MTVNNIPLNSPFEHVLDKLSIPPIFQEQFLFSADAPYAILLEGKMNRVWHRPIWLWPVLRFLAWFNILFPETGAGIKAFMQIIGGRDQWGTPFHKWNRTFAFPNIDRFFNAVMIYNTKLQAIAEKMGPAGLIQMLWCVEFFPPSQIKISTTQCYLSIGRLQVCLPTFLYPMVCAVESDIGNDTLHIDLMVSHPWLGEIFGYDGEFKVTRIKI